MKRLFPLVAAALLATVIDAAAQNAVFVVRHAERADAGSGATTMATDPELSDIGRTRAQSLAAMLKDAGVTVIFVTEYKRTQQTAEPLAKLLGIQATVVSAKDTQGLIEKVKAVTGRALVVGHSNTVPEVLGKLGVENPPKLADSDYGDLFLVSRGDTTTLFRLHYR
ncbi:MAG: histidine phosphatase family protein [Acidobacteria bacterium]|nr:histidine phosphatase family protein [Acidobacteriota bacterium]